MSSMNTRNNPTTISTASSLHTGSHITPVYLNLYDLGGCSNTCIHSIGFSFYHCAVQTHSVEYGYMGHPYYFTGLYKTSKHDSRFHLYRLRHSIEISWTWLNEKEIDQMINDLKPFYLGWDYHLTKKNSIHFAKYLLEQLSNDSQLKHLESIQIIQFPSYIDRGRRLSETLEFLQIFDTEKEIAEINILFFLYMKSEGNIKQICQILQCDTIDKLKRLIQLIEQGIEQKKLPRFSSFDMARAYEYLSIKKETNPDEQLTLTEIFHQFDTITLRGRTSIDRYLNFPRPKQMTPQSPIQTERRLTIDLSEIPDRTRVETISEQNYQNKQRSSVKHNAEHPTLSQTYRSSQPQAISQNQGQTPMTSPAGSNIFGLVNSSIINQSTPYFHEYFPMRTTVPMKATLRLQPTSNEKNLPFNEVHLGRNVHNQSFSFFSNRPRKLLSSTRKRKLPRDLQLTSDLYTITPPKFLSQNYTNNAISSFSLHSQSIENNENTDSSV